LETISLSSLEKNYELSIQAEIGFILFALGMITVGIPHGAVDHLLGAGTWNQRKAPIFILRYLLLAGVMIMLWLVMPQIALIVFLLYSMWHFGEADGKSWDFDCMTSLLWGISLLVYILGTHFDETNTILTSIGSLSFPFAIPIWFLIPWLLWAVYKKQFSLFLTTIFLILSSQIPLLFAFGIYFIGQHSLTGWKHLKIYLRRESKDIWLQSLPFHIGAWII
jgi:beta-carotene 15,15'-dioxygenase